MLDHRLGLSRLLPDEARDRVQRVEQEVRLHARGQRRELCLGGQLLGALAFQLLRSQRQLGRLDAGVGRADQDHRDADDDRHGTVSTMCSRNPIVMKLAGMTPTRNGTVYTAAVPAAAQNTIVAR